MFLEYFSPFSGKPIDCEISRLGYWSIHISNLNKCLIEFYKKKKWS